MKISTSLIGATALKISIEELEGKFFRKAARKAVNDGTKLVLASAKSLVPKRTGSLKKSLGRKVKANKNGTGYYGLVGPRKDSRAKIAQSIRDVEAGKRKKALTAKYRRVVRHNGRDILVNPVKYAHMVEYGRGSAVVKEKKVMSDGVAVFGTKIRAIPPRPFLRPAWDNSKAAINAIVRSAMQSAVREAAKSGRGRK